MPRGSLPEPKRSASGSNGSASAAAEGIAVAVARPLAFGLASTTKLSAVERTGAGGGGKESGGAGISGGCSRVGRAAVASVAETCGLLEGKG